MPTITPRWRAKALPAARTYAQIAPAASHALHMPSHAFVQLGYWDDAAASDQASWDASVAWVARKGVSLALRDFHSLTWLHYEWTQQGRFGKAAEALAARRRRTEGGRSRTSRPEDITTADSEIGRGSGPMALRNDRGSMRARYIIESERWHEMKGQAQFDNIDELFALGMASVRLGDLGRARRGGRRLFVDAAAPGQDAGLREQAAVMAKELEALIAYRAGTAGGGVCRHGSGDVSAQAACRSRLGGPYPVKGADELYGELLLGGGTAQGRDGLV